MIYKSINQTDKGHKNIQGKNGQIRGLTRARDEYYQVLAMTEAECETYYRRELNGTRQKERETG